MLSIRMMYLGGSRSSTGVREEALELTPGSTLQDAVNRVRTRHPALAAHLPHVRWARNGRFTSLDTPLSQGDELALVPPVAGGAPAVHIGEAPLDPTLVQRWVAGPDMGACVLFVGTVRDVNAGMVVTSLSYEAYEPMATTELERLVAACEALHPGTRIAVAHRVGLLRVGDMSVVIAAAAPHRDAAFDACRQALERLKTDVPIYKQEQRETGAVWVGWGGG